MEKIDVNQMSPLVWAYIGDSVYEQYIREYLDTVLCAGWEDIEKFMEAMTDCGMPYENQVEMIKTLAKSIELLND